MAGSLRRGERQVSWASRTNSSTSPRSPHSASGLQRETIAEESTPALSQAGHPFLSPAEGRQVDNSPGVFSPDGPRPPPEPRPKANSAPSAYGPYQQISASTLSTNLSLDPGLRAKVAGASTAQLSGSFELDAEAPQRAIRDRRGTEEGSGGSKLHVVAELEERGEEVDGHATDPQAPADADSTWGDSFRVEWICTERLPFHRTRFLRNPWNHDKEIKVSRDGTELEPTVGLQLLDEWKRYLHEVAVGELRPTTGGLKHRGAASHSASPSIVGEPPSSSAPAAPKDRKTRAP